MFTLLIGTRRSKFNGSGADKLKHQTNSAELVVKNKTKFIDQYGLQCQACSFKKPNPNSSSDIFLAAVDGNLENSTDENLKLFCQVCNAYQELENSVKGTISAPNAMGKIAIVATISEVSAVDINLLQRAIGLALLDPAESSMANAINKRLSERAFYVKNDFGSLWPKDFASAMKKLNAEEYDSREESIDDLRLIFNKDMLREFGAEVKTDYPDLVLPWNNVDVVTPDAITESSDQ